MLADCAPATVTINVGPVGTQLAACRSINDPGRLAGDGVVARVAATLGCGTDALAEAGDRAADDAGDGSADTHAQTAIVAPIATSLMRMTAPPRRTGVEG